MTKRKIIIIIFFILFIIIGVGTAFLLNKDKQKPDLSEENFLKEGNSQIVNEINTDNILKAEDINKDDYYQGSLDAPVELIVYCDYADIFCADLYDAINEIKNIFGDSVNIAYRNFLVGDNNISQYAAISAECAGEQGKFWQMHDALYDLNKNNKFNKENIRQVAIDTEIDTSQYDNCLLSERYVDKIDKQMERAKKFGVIGVPTIFVNKEVLPGAYPLDDFTDSAGRERLGLRSIIEKYLN